MSVTDFGDADPADAYDAEEAPEVRIAVILRWLERADEERDGSALRALLKKIGRDLADARMASRHTELGGYRALAEALIEGLP